MLSFKDGHNLHSSVVMMRRSKLLRMRNKGKLTGAKPPLRPKHVWSIRTKLQIEGGARDLAMFNLTIDSKLRGCDVVAIRVEEAALNSQRPISKLSGHQQRVSLQLEELLQEGLNVLMGFVRRRFLVVAARKPFFIARIAWRKRLRLPSFARSSLLRASRKSTRSVVSSPKRIGCSSSRNHIC